MIQVLWDVLLCSLLDTCQLLPSCSGYHIAEDSVPHFVVIVKLVFVLCFMIPGNNDALTSFAECVALRNSQSRVGDQYLFVKHALIPPLFVKHALIPPLFLSWKLQVLNCVHVVLQ